MKTRPLKDFKHYCTSLKIIHIPFFSPPNSRLLHSIKIQVAKQSQFWLKEPIPGSYWLVDPPQLFLFLFLFLQGTPSGTPMHMGPPSGAVSLYSSFKPIVKKSWIVLKNGRLALGRGGSSLFSHQRKGLGCWLSLALSKKSDLIMWVGKKQLVSGDLFLLWILCPTQFTPTKNARKSCLAFVPWMHCHFQTICKRACLFWCRKQNIYEKKKSLLCFVFWKILPQVSWFTSNLILLRDVR